MKYKIVLFLMIFHACFTKYATSKSLQSGTENEINRIFQFLDNTETNLKNHLKSAVKASLPYLMKMTDEVNISSSCKRSVMLFLKDLMQLKEWTIKLLDSFGKPPSSILEMTAWMQGDYDQCLNLHIDKDKIDQSIQAKYCALTIEFPAMRNAEIIEKIAEYKNNTLIRLLHIFSEPSQFSNILKGLAVMNTGPRLDVCIPSTCSKKDLENIGYWAFPEQINLRVDFCKVKDERMEYSTAQVICLTVFAFFIICIVVALLLEISILKYFCIKKGRFLEIILLASPFKSVRKLFSINIKENNTRFIYGMKVLLLFMIIYIHELLFFLQLPTTGGNISFIFHDLGKFSYAIFNQLTIMLETFFFLSGFILSYLRRENNNSIIHYFIFLLKRTIRLTIPMICALAIVIILPLLGDGPRWNYIIRQGKFYESHWWKFVLHIHNLYEKEIHSNILVPAWFMSALMQLAIITVPLLIIRDRYPKIGNIIISILILVGITNHVSVIFIRKYHGLFGKNLDAAMFQGYLYTHYYKPYYSHLGTYLFGLLIGHFISKNRKVKFGQITLILSWTASIIVMGLTVFGIHKYSSTFPANENILMIYQCAAPFVWTIAFAWVCVACIAGYGGIVNWFFSLRIFVILGEISLWIYLLNYIIIAYIFGEMRKAFPITELNLWMLYCWISVLTLIASFFVYVLIESPINSLLSKCIFSKLSPKKEKEISKLETMPPQDQTETHQV